MLHGLLDRIRSVVRRGAVEAEMDEEMQEHLARATELFMRRGMTEQQAATEARRQFGNRGVIEEDARDARGVRWAESFRRDTRRGMRAILRTPGFAFVVVLTLGLGFGVNSALFSVMKAVTTFTTVPEPETWVNIPALWSWSGFALLRDSSRTLTSLTASAEAPVVMGSMTTDGDPIEVRARFVSEGYFAALRGRPLRGRVFLPDETAPPVGAPVAVLSYRFWDLRFARDTGVIGQSVRLGDGQPFTIVGVMPRDFTGPSPRSPDLWLPLGARARLPGDADRAGTPGDHTWFGADGAEFLFIAGRLRAGATLPALRAELTVLGPRMAPGDTARGRDIAPAIRALGIRAVDSTGGELAAIGLVFAAALSVLLIACVTVANLMLARAAARRRDMGVRLALGASRRRVVAEWMVECLLLALAGALVGLWLSWWTTRLVVTSHAFVSMVDGGDPEVFARMFSPSPGVAVALVCLAFLSTLVFGLVPALRATRSDPLTTLRDSGSSGQAMRLDGVRLRGGLVVSQVALTLVLMLAAGMMLRGVLAATRLDPGFDHRTVYAVSPRLTLSGYDSLRARLFHEEFIARARSVGGVQNVTRGHVPMENAAAATIGLPGDAQPERPYGNGSFNAVSETFFETLGIEIVRGRGFTAAEVRTEAPVAVVSASTARLLWPDAEPIGQLVSVVPRVRGGVGQPEVGRFDQARVIGVAADARMNNLAAVSRRYVYVPGDYGTVMIRVGDPGTIEGLRRLARGIDPDVAVSIRSLEDVVWHSSGWLESARLLSSIAASVGALSLLMAVVGLFGLTAYAVEQRTREFGVRMALGAQSGSVVRLVAGESLRLVVVGAVIGLLGGIAGGGVLRNFLFGVRAVDPSAFAIVTAVLVVVAMVSCYLPARRATRVDPMVALRAD